MTTKLYEIISATQLMHEPWHFVIKVADLNPNVPICGQVYSFIDEDNKKLELIPVGNNSNGTLTIADIFDKISNDYDLLLNNLKDLIKENTNNVHNN